ncbi:MAG: DUF2306 domain-containing protein [Stackebrandtia sp.]
MEQSTLAEPEAKPVRQIPKTRWWKRPWVVPLWAICAIFFVWRVPNYLGFTPENSLVELRSETHYLLLSGHIVIGTVALSACCLQVWPWLRQNHPKVHRVSGRIYVAAVLPGSVLALTSSVMSVVPIPGRVGNVMLSVLWLGTTLTGFYMARNRRFAEHRRWMIRSFALCFSIVVSRLWIGIWFAALTPFSDTHYNGDMDALAGDLAVGAIWCSWVVNLLIAEWWIERGRRPRKRPVKKAPAPAEVGV